MSSLFSVTFEGNKLYNPNSDGFDFVGVWGGSIAVSAAAKHNGSYGCAVSPYVGQRAAGAKRVNSLTRIRQAFWLHPNAVNIPTTKYLILARNYHNDASQCKYILWLSYVTGTGYQISGGLDSNASETTYASGDYTLDNQTNWNLIEVDWYANASGFMKIWINGTLKWNQAVNNSSLRITYPALGAFAPNAAMSGSFWIDDWRANDDGSVIGA